MIDCNSDGHHTKSYPKSASFLPAGRYANGNAFHLRSVHLCTESYETLLYSALLAVLEEAVQPKAILERTQSIT